VLVVGRADEERVCELAGVLVGQKLRAGDHLLMDARSGLVVERLPRPEVEELVLEEVPDVTYDDVGGAREKKQGMKGAVREPHLPAVPAPPLFFRPPPAAAEGAPAVRTAGLRQDAHREGGRELAREARRGEDR